MNIFTRWALHRAARRYARLLPGELPADYGSSDTYTAGQVAAALDRRGEDGRYVAIAYAAFLTEADYLGLAHALPLVLPYDNARELFRRGQPWGDRYSALRDMETTSGPMPEQNLFRP
jgi:hypothetical protein